MGVRLILLGVVLAVVLTGEPARATIGGAGAQTTAVTAAATGAKSPMVLAAKKKAPKGKGKKNKGKKRGGDTNEPESGPGAVAPQDGGTAPANTQSGATTGGTAPAATQGGATQGGAAAGGSAAGGTAGADTGVLDLSAGVEDSAAAKQELLQGGTGDEKKDDKKDAKVKRTSGGGFDFGGGVEIDLGGDSQIDFGGADFGNFDIQLNVESEERKRVDKAISMMSDEDYAAAALEFRYFLDDAKFAEFKPESEYQLAKALYKLGFYEAALKRFKSILEQGPTHPRYRKSIEWLFFMSRKMADETPVLQELARFRNVTFPKAYRNEYRYLLSKYLFVQAQRFEVERLEEAQLARSKKSKEATLDFSALENAVNTGNDAGIDFGSIQGMDFGGADMGSAIDFSGAAPAGGGGGGGAGGLDFGAPAGGAGGGGGGDGGGFDFGAPAGGGGSGGGGAGGGGGGASGGGGFDFSGGGGFDFSSGGAAPAQPPAGAAPGTAAPPADAGPVRDTAPTTAKEAITQGVDFVTQVEKDSRFYARAAYLQGLLHYLGAEAEQNVDAKKAEDQKAIAAFQEVVRVLNPRAGGKLDPKLREQAFLSLARLHYGYKQFNKSVYYYDQIDRDSENWLTALFEASWAYYRRGDFEKALGNLLTLHSPFFEREYFPESQLVKAIIYFEACRYPETLQIVNGFIDRYTDVMKAIEKIATSQEAPELLYERIAQLQKEAAENEEDATSRVVALALGDPDIRTARAVVEQVSEQLDLWRQMPEEFRSSRLGSDLNEDLRQAMAEKTRAAGEVTRKKFESEMYSLKSLLAQAFRIRIEVSRTERTALEAKRAGEGKEDELVPAPKRTVVDDEHVYWPYEGEYWRDELGTYELDFTMCRPLAAGT